MKFNISTAVRTPCGDDGYLVIETSPDNCKWTRLAYDDEAGEMDELIAFPHEYVEALILALKAYKAQLEAVNEIRN